MIYPLIIHQIWWQGFDNVPLKYKKYLQSWKKNHSLPEWKIIYWNKHIFENEILNQYPNYINIYKNLPFMIQKIDFAKYLILYHMGGIYVDVDTISEKSLELFLKKYDRCDVILTKFKVFEELPIYVINNGIIMSKEKHPLLKNIIENIPTHQLFYDINDWYILKSTGPYYFTKIILKYLSEYQDKGIMIIPNDVLESCTLSEYQKCTSKGTYITHDHNCSWASWGFKNILYSIVFLKDYIKYFIIFCITLITLYLIKK